MNPQELKRQTQYGDKPVPDWYRPPMGTKGNKAALKHGAHSPDAIKQQAVEIRQELLSKLPFLAEEQFAIAFELFCTACAEVELLSDWIWSVREGRTEAYHRDPNHPKTGVQAVPEYLQREYGLAVQRAQKMAQDLGLDPIGFAKLAKELGWAENLAGQRVNDLVSRGRQLRRGGK